MPQISSKIFFDKLLQQITVYENQEAKEIVFWLMEFYLGLSKIDIFNNKLIDNQSFIDWGNITKRLNSHEPIQYILGETEFYGRRFLVNESVLIPRPETEELVQLVVENNRQLAVGSQQSAVGNRQSAVGSRKSEINTETELRTQHSKAERRPLRTILDIGTGSGCIAISLAKELPNFKVFAYDISEKALETARKNAILNNAEVVFEKVDILNYQLPIINYQLSFDIIVSNPPYVTRQEIELIQKNVLGFEPHLALFVENTEPLIFYEAIADFALNNLADNGLVAVEINEVLGPETANVFMQKGFSEVEIIKDIHQKNRFVRATLHKKDKE